MGNVMKQHNFDMQGGVKTVCVSHCLDFFEIPLKGYKYTSSKKDVMAYKKVLRRFGWSVRSKKTEFKALKRITMTELKRNMKRSGYGSKDFFVVHGIQRAKAHLMVLDGNGVTIIDTAKGKKWRIKDVSIVEKPYLD